MRALSDRVDRSPLLRGLVFLLFAAVFQAVVSVYNTPLNPYYGYDSAFFLLIGKGITAGKLPYLDLYDQKGPMVFYFNALGYMLTGSRTGVFLLQVVFFTASLLVLYRIVRGILADDRRWLAMGLFCLLYIGTVKDGDMTEEWSLIFSLVPMALALGFLRREQPVKTHPFGYSLVYGLCTGVLALFRVTNAALPAGLILGFTLLLVREKAPLALMKNALGVLLGVLAVTAPVCLYFLKAGAFDSFIYASLLHNFSYAVDGASTKSLTDWAAILASIAFLPVTLAAAPRMARDRTAAPGILTLASCMGLTGSFAMTLGYGFRHYFLIVAPALTLDYCLWLKWLRSREGKTARPRRLAAAVLTALVLLPYVPQMVRQGGKVIVNDVLRSPETEKRQYEALNEYVPRGSEGVWGYNVRAKAYLYMDVLPCQRYFAEQEWMMETNPMIREELEEFLAQGGPEWIFMGRSETQMLQRLTDELGYAFPEGFDPDSPVLLLHRQRG